MFPLSVFLLFSASAFSCRCFLGLALGHMASFGFNSKHLHQIKAVNPELLHAKHTLQSLFSACLPADRAPTASMLMTDTPAALLQCATMGLQWPPSSSWWWSP